MLQVVQGAEYPMAADRHYTPGSALLEALRGHMARRGLERVVIVQPSVYGCDNRFMLALLLQDIDAWLSASALREWVLVDNPARLYGFR